jgi:hypothetical protein
MRAKISAHFLLLPLMKRTLEQSAETDAVIRDIDVIEKEKDEAWKRFAILDEEFGNHPEIKKRRERARRQKLIDNLPRALHAELIDVPYPTLGSLEQFDVESVIDEDDLVRVWTFSVKFSQTQTLDYTADDNDNTTGFDAVNFDPRPLRLWHRALDENNDDVCASLAAFCHACCEHLGDDTAMPVEAFPVPKGKDKEVDV